MTNNWKKMLKYTTLEVIEHLRKELQIYAEELAQIFPDRRKKYSDRDLSRLWQGSSFTYIARIKGRITNPSDKAYNPDYRFNKKAIEILKEKLAEKLGAKAIGTYRIISRYQDNLSRITTLRFIDILKEELGRISGDVWLDNEELSLILAGDKDFIHRSLDTIKNPLSKRWYNPDYKFPLERLDYFITVFREILGYKAEKCIQLIEQYKLLNEDLSYWHPKDYSIEKPHFFNSIDTIVKAYWYGFLGADGSLEKNRPRIKFELSAKDKDRIVEFVDVIGLDIKRIEEFERIYRYKGELKKSVIARISFSSAEMAQDLLDLGFREMKENVQGIPEFVISLIRSAKSQVKGSSLHWATTYNGRIACAWLLGFYDGDGTFLGGRQARVYNSNKKILEDIKEYFGVENNVNAQTPRDKIIDSDIQSKKPMYYLTLGPEVFEAIIFSYDHSMQRKRPTEQSHFNFNFLGDFS